jgi:dihydrofolate reductase
MTKIIYGADMTLDGVVEGPDRWRFDYISPELQQYDQSKVNSLDAMLLGRKTFEGFAAFWPTQTHNEYGIADKLNSALKFVVSSTLKEADWNNSSIINGVDLGREVQKLKEQLSGDIGITGSISVAQELMQRNLIDQYDFLIFPLVLGSGRRLFNGGTNMPMELVETKSFGRGVVLSRYKPARKK